LDDIELKISNDYTILTDVSNKYANAKGYYSTLQDRLNSIDGDSNNTGTFFNKSMASHLSDLQSEIIAARTSTADDITYSSLDNRFEAIETEIGNVKSDKISHSEIVADLTTNSDNRPLAASKGRELALTIGGGYNASNTVATGISNAE